MDNIVIRKNVLKNSQIEEIIKEIKKNELKTDDRGFSKFDRWYPPPGNILIKIAEDMIFTEDIMTEVDNSRDLAWRWYLSNNNVSFEVMITKYYLKPEYKYDWHTDHVTPKLTDKFRMLNYVFYINDDFKGGELQLTKSLERGIPNLNSDYPISLSIKPEKNKLVIIPSWILHRVTSVTSGSPRLTLNGHIIKE